MRTVVAALSLAGLSSGCAHVMVTARVSATALRMQPRQAWVVAQPRANTAGDVAVRTAPGARDQVVVVIENHSATQPVVLDWDRALYVSAAGAKSSVVARRSTQTAAGQPWAGDTVPPGGRVDAQILGLDSRSLTAGAIPPAARDGDVVPVGALQLPVVTGGVSSVISLELTYRLSVLPEARTAQTVEAVVTRRMRIPAAQRVFCILTAWYYGGTCWLNFIWPTPSQRQRVIAEAYQQLVRDYGPGLIDVQSDTERTGW